LRDIIRDYGLQATKALGQNFLLDLNLTGAIAREGGDLSGTDVVEIGPGPGGLSRAILSAGARSLHAIEYDPRAIDALQSLVAASDGRMVLHRMDALDAKLDGFGADGARAVMANLPYNIATPLLVGFLREQFERKGAAWHFMLLMFQREVAERIVAAPSTKAYGRLSVMAQWMADVKIVKTLPPDAFTPPPKVHSSVVRFRPRPFDAQWPSFDVMEKVVAAAFGQRRKMLRGALGPYAVHLAEAGIDETARAEDVDVASFVRLARIVEGAGA